MRQAIEPSLRVPPHSVDAEQAVLGGIMLSPQAFHRVDDLLSPGDFYRRDHQLIYTAMRELEERNRPFDAVTLGEWFESQGKLELVGDGAYLVELATTTPSAANVRAYAEIVHDRAVKRALIEAGTCIVNDAFGNEAGEGEEQLIAAQARLADVLRTQPCELETPIPVLKRIAENLTRRIEHGAGSMEGLATGYADLDEILWGLKPGDLVVVAGRPGMGKTTLAMNIAEHVALRQNVRTAIHSLEMPSDQLLTRAICSVGRIPHDHVRRADLTDEDWSRFTSATSILRHAPLVISKPRNARVQQIIAQTQREHSVNPLGLVVIDYLQLMDTAGAENKNLGISEATRALKLMGVAMGVPVVLLSQLSREVDKRPNKRPVLADLRDSGSIEQDADVVIFVYRDEVYDKASPDKGTTEVIVAKQRNGATGECRLQTRLDVCRFDPLSPDWRPAIAQDETPRPRRSAFARRARPGEAQD
ncbi:MAG TPA: replicative DNA helicase [Stenotrophomonas sp.]|nr:replicative DNA helicase [Stenotrophomonas sp.]